MSLILCTMPQCQTSAGCICERQLRPIRSQATTPPVESKSDQIVARLKADIEKAHWEAWNGLARMKWSQFGYWAAAWVRDNRKVVGDDIRTIRSRPSPFKILTDVARAVRAELDAGHGIPAIIFTIERRNIDEGGRASAPPESVTVRAPAPQKALPPAGRGAA